MSEFELHNKINIIQENFFMRTGCSLPNETIAELMDLGKNNIPFGMVFERKRTSEERLPYSRYVRLFKMVNEIAIISKIKTAD